MSTTLPKSPAGIIEWPGSEPIRTTRDRAIDTLRACRFIHEPVRVRANGKWTQTRDIPAVDGLTAAQTLIAEELLLHRMQARLWDLLPKGIKSEIIDCAYNTSADPDAPMWSESIIEIGDGWTIGCTVEPGKSYRAAIHWHSFNPEGDPIVENTTDVAALAALAGQLASHHIIQNFGKEEA